MLHTKHPLKTIVDTLGSRFITISPKTAAFWGLKFMVEGQWGSAHWDHDMERDRVCVLWPETDTTELQYFTVDAFIAWFRTMNGMAYEGQTPEEQQAVFHAWYKRAWNRDDRLDDFDEALYESVTTEHRANGKPFLTYLNDFGDWICDLRIDSCIRCTQSFQYRTVQHLGREWYLDVLLERGDWCDAAVYRYEWEMLSWV